MKKRIGIAYMADEQLSIEIGGADQIDLKTLTDFLTHTLDSLTIIANESVGDDVSCRFTVKDIRKGSFIIDIQQIIVAGIQLFPQITPVISCFKEVLETRKLLKGSQPDSVVHENGRVKISKNEGTVTVTENTYNIYCNNPDIEKSCAAAIQTICKDGTRTGVRYTADDETIDVHHDELTQLSKPVDVQKLNNNVLNRVTDHIKVRVFKLDLQGNSKWGISAIGKTLLVNIEDEEFLRKVHDSEIAFSNNTILEVDLMSEYYTDSNGQPVENSKAKYTITKVYSVENMTVEQQQLNI